MKKIIVSIGIIILLLLGAWGYIQWYVEQYANQKIFEYIQKEDKYQKSSIEKKQREARRLFDMAMHYYRKGKPQPYLAQSAFFKYIDSEVGEEEIVSRIKQLIQTELVDVNAYNEQDQTALLSASLDNEYSLVKLLLESGAKVNQLSQDGTQTALFAALLKPDIVQLLLKYNADPNLRGPGGTTPLMKVFEFINVSLEYEDPVRIMNKAKEIINLLLAYGADPYIKNNKSKTVFDILKESQNYFETGKTKVSDQELIAPWAHNMSENRKMVIKILDEIKQDLQSRGKISRSK